MFGSALANHISPWMGVWFGMFPTEETPIAEILAAKLDCGSSGFVRLCIILQRRS